MLSVACGGSASDEDAGPPRRQDPCEAAPTREPCRWVDVDGQDVRYTVVTPAAGAGDDAVVVDLGGPGLALLSGSSNLSELGTEVPALGDRFSLVFVEEPWVTTPLDDGCRDALREFYVAVRDLSADAPDGAAGVVDACHVGDAPRRWGHDAERYSGAVEAIAEEEGLDIHGFLGQSFGDVRASYLAGDSYDWAVFLRPFPLERTGDVILGERATLAAASAGLGVEPSRPSADVAVESFDMASALLGLGYLGPSEREAVRPGVVDGTDTASIRSLSDRVWQVYGEGDLSPAYLAYLDEVCAAATGWPGYEPGRASIANVLAAAHLPCASVGAGPAGPAGGNALTRERSCAVVSPNDPISPASLVDAASTVVVDAVDHQSIDGLDECLRRVGAVG